MEIQDKITLPGVFPINKLPFSEIDLPLNSIRSKILGNAQSDYTFSEWSNLPGSYGAYCGDIERLNIPLLTECWPNVPTILNEKNFRGIGNDSLEISEQIIFHSSFNNTQYTIRSEHGELEPIRLYDLSLGTFIDNVVTGLLYIMNALKCGVPVIAGVNCQQYSSVGNLDESTDHYIVIVGMGNNGRNYLLGWDTACLLSEGRRIDMGGKVEGISSENKIYLDADWPGLLRADEVWPNFYAVARQKYKITQIFKTFILQP